MSQDTVVWAKGNMPFATKEIIRKNLYGEKYIPADQYNQKDLDVSDNARKLQIASFWQDNQVYQQSIPLLKSLYKAKYSPSYPILAEAYVKGQGVAVDTTHAISLYEKAYKKGESVQKRLGWLCYDAHQYKQALNNLKFDANAEACYVVGLIYEKGRGGVKENLDSALYYYNKGLALLKSERYSVREKYYESVDRVSNNIKYNKADFVELERKVAQTMGKDSLYGKYKEIRKSGDMKKAYSYLKAAADSLYPVAEADMADFMMNSRYPFNNQEKAYEYLRRAVQHYLEYAQNGDSSAYYSIAQLYRYRDVEGNGSDMNKAIDYYKLGIEHNHVRSATELGTIYYGQFDYKKALDAYLIGAKAGDTNCMYQTAFLYELGASGLEENISQANYWYRRCFKYAKSKFEKDRVQKALQRIGTSYKEEMSGLVGVWLHNRQEGYGKIFLPNGHYFGFCDVDDAVSQIKNKSYNPWFLGEYRISGKRQYVEDVEMHIQKDIGGEQTLSFEINNDKMKSVWNEYVEENWQKHPQSEEIIQYIMENWTQYVDYNRSHINH
jgi:TPR repeat protein